MSLLTLLEQSRPVFLLCLLLPQDKLNIFRSMMRLAIFNINVAVKLELDVICGFLGFRVAGEGKACGFQIDVNFRDVRSRDGQEDEILLSIRT